MSYGNDLPGTALFAPIEWLLHVNDRAHCPPFGRVTPHCRSTSTGPFGLAGFLASSFFFFFFGSLSASPSVFRFFDFFAVPSSPILFFELFWPFISPTSSTPLASSSLALSFSFALFAASRASFFFRAFSCLARKQPRICSAPAAFRTALLQCLHIIVSSVVSLGLPVGNKAIALSSISGRIGDVGSRDTSSLEESKHT